MIIYIIIYDYICVIIYIWLYIYDYIYKWLYIYDYINVIIYIWLYIYDYIYIFDFIYIWLSIYDYIYILLVHSSWFLSCLVFEWWLAFAQERPYLVNLFTKNNTHPLVTSCFQVGFLTTKQVDDDCGPCDHSGLNIYTVYIYM
jgi:hypothetical protein